MIVRAAPSEHFGWMLSRIGYAPTAGFKAIEAIDYSGAIAGMIGYDNWTPNSVNMHVFLERPIAWRALVRPAFEYPFLQAGKEYVLGLLPASRSKVVKFLSRLGFREQARIRDGFAKGDDLIFSALHRDDCPVLRKAA